MNPNEFHFNTADDNYNVRESLPMYTLNYENPSQVLTTSAMDVSMNVGTAIMTSQFYNDREFDNQKQFMPKKRADYGTDYSQYGLSFKRCSGYELIDQSSDSSLFRAVHRIRLGTSELCTLLTSNAVFDWAILCIILMNTVTLAVEDPQTEDQGPVLELLDLIFLYIYTVEAALKIGAVGICKYLKDSWNLLDFAVVLTGWIEYKANEGINLSALRALRVLRPLRSIASIKGLRVLIIALVNSFKPLMFALIVFFFFLSLFAVSALQLWMGLFKLKCLDVHSGEFTDTSCASCQCTESLDNPNYGVTNFDNFLFSLLAVFQCVTLEGWTEIMEITQKNFSYYSVIFFTPLVFIGAFLMINFILAVVKYHFTSAIKFETAKQNEKHPLIVRERFTKTRKLSQVVANNTDIDICNDEVDYEVDEHKPDEDRIFWNVKRKMKVNDRKLSSNNSKHKKDSAVNGIEMRLKGREILWNYKYSVKENAFPTSESQSDVIGPQRLPKVNLDGPFVYVTENEEEEIEIACIFEEFSYLMLRNSSDESFFKLIPSGGTSVVQKLMSKEGPWSGTDVSPGVCLEKTKDYIKDLSFMKYTLWSSSYFQWIEKTRFLLKKLVLSTLFSRIIILCVIMNSLVLSMDHYGIEAEFEEMLVLLNTIFTSIFVLEMILKLCGLGLLEYLKDKMNYIDALVVIISSIELTFLSDSVGLTVFRTIRVLKMFKVLRVLRVARLFRYINSMTVILNVIGNSIYSFMYLALLLLLFSVIFSLLGMGLFGGHFNFEEGKPRANFDSFHDAFVTVFQVLTMEDWQLVLYDGMRSSIGYASSLYFIAWIFLGNFVFLNLFLAIVLDSFDNDYKDSEAKKEDEQSKMSLVRQEAMRKRKMKEEKKLQQLIRMHETQRIEEMMETRPIQTHYDEIENLNAGRSFYVFEIDNSLRKFCHSVSNSRHFENFMLCVIILSSIKLIWDTYLILDAEGDTTASDVFDYAFTFFFCIEFLTKAISQGFIMEKGSYLRESWNLLDFSIILISLLEMAVLSADVQYLAVFRLLRTLRPLRFITHNLSMKMVVNALFESLYAIMNVAIVLLIIWLMFAILGVSLFSGKFYSCQNEEIKEEALCESYSYRWKNADFHFDNVPEAILTLFVVSSLEGWPTIMHLAVDTQDSGLAPAYNNNPAAAYYFIAFILIVSFFSLNLFIGVVFQQFNKAKNDKNAAYSLVLNERELKWIEIQSLIISSRPSVEVKQMKLGTAKRVAREIVNSCLFEGFIGFSIVANMVLMASIYDGAGSSYLDILEIMNICFSFAFIAEAVLKITAFGKDYFSNNWNRFDFFVVIVSVIDITLLWTKSGSFVITAPQIGRVIRLLRVSRVVRSWEVLNPLQDLIIVMGVSLPAILNVLSLLLLLFFIYGILGAFLFHGLEEGRVIHDLVNFRGFGMALVALLRAATGENWNLMMKDIDDRYGTLISVLYFCSFLLLTSFIMLNLFVMVIVQAYEDYMKNPENSRLKFLKDIEKIKTAWLQFSTTRLPYKKLTNFMKALGKIDPLLGFPELISEAMMMGVLYSMDLVIDQEGFVYYNDLLYAVLKRRYFHKKMRKQNSLQRRIVKKQEKTTLRKLELLRQQSQINVSKQFLFTYTYLRGVFKAWKNWTKGRIKTVKS